LVVAGPVLEEEATIPDEVMSILCDDAPEAPEVEPLGSRKRKSAAPFDADEAE
jgi:hypothetical protein